MDRCEHRAGVLRKRAGVGGTKVQRQCDDCCRGVGESVPLSAFPADQRLRFKAWISTPHPTSKTQVYDAYLRSDAWKAIRLLVLDRDSFTCRNCGEPATDAHHLTYDRFGHEKLADLVASCRACNTAEAEARRSGLA